MSFIVQTTVLTNCLNHTTMKRIIQLSLIFGLAIVAIIAYASKKSSQPQPESKLIVVVKALQNAPQPSYVDSTTRVKVFDVVEQMPQYPGGDEKMFEFIAQHLKYPDIAVESCVQGSVFIRFIVFSNGKPGDYKVLRSLDPAFDKEAIRVLKLMPRWIPGKQNGVNVNVYFYLPIKFKLE